MARHTVQFKVTALVDMQVDAPSLADAIAAVQDMKTYDIIKPIGRSAGFCDYGKPEIAGVFSNEVGI